MWADRGSAPYRLPLGSALGALVLPHGSNHPYMGRGTDTLVIRTVEAGAPGQSPPGAVAANLWRPAQAILLL